jgi:hypothetical protein
MRTTLLALLGSALALPLAACGSVDSDDEGAAHIGVLAELETMPSVTIDDELGTDVRVFVHLDHSGGPDAETFEVVSASLKLDLEHYADIELAIPMDHPAFPGLVDGQSLDLELRGSIPDSHDDWGLCGDPETEDDDANRVSIEIMLRVTPGANSAENEYLFESQAVELTCSHTG